MMTKGGKINGHAGGSHSMLKEDSVHKMSSGDYNYGSGGRLEAEGQGECIIVADKYIMQRQIGKGSFGEVYRGFDKDTKEAVAIKIVSNLRVILDRNLLSHFRRDPRLRPRFFKSYKATVKDINYIMLPYIDGVPKLYYYGTEGDYHVLVMELLGPNLGELVTLCEMNMSLKSVLMIADQLVSADSIILFSIINQDNHANYI